MRRPSRSLLALGFVSALLLAPLGAGADEAAERAALHALFEHPAIDPDLFAPNFTAKVPVADVQGFVDSVRTRLGEPTAYVKDGFQYRLVAPRGSIGVNVAFDQAGKISSLLFHDEMSSADLAALLEVMKADKVSADWFEPAFSSDVPAAKVDDVVAGLRAKYGGFVRVDARKRGYVAVFARGEAHAQISVAPDGKIDYLAFTEAN